MVAVKKEIDKLGKHERVAIEFVRVPTDYTTMEHGPTMGLKTQSRHSKYAAATKPYPTYPNPLKDQRNTTRGP